MEPTLDHSFPDHRLPRKTAIFALTVTTLLACNTFLAFGGLGVAMEDAAIHLSLAKGLFSEGFFTLSAGEPSGATTSPLWVFLTGLVWFITGSVQATTTLMSTLSVAALASALFCYFEEEDRLLALTFSGFSICMGPVLWHLFSGMETAAFCAAVFWCGHFLNKQDYRFASWSAAVALLLRMEGILLLGLIAMALFRQFRKEGKGMDLRLWRDGLVRPLSALAVFMVLNVLHTGRVLPSTGDAKRFLFGVYYHGVDAIPEVPARLVDMAGAWWSLFEKGLGRNGVEWLYPLLGAMSLFGLLFLGLRRSRGLLFFLSWSLLLNLVYAVDLPILEVAGRYQATNLFLFSMGLAGCVCFLVRPELLGAKWVGRFLPWRQGMAVVGAMVALTIMACLSLSGTRWGQGRAVQIKHLEAVHQRAGLWLKDNNPECLPILLGEVGWVSFHTQDSEVCQPPLFDYYGVTDPAYFRAVQEGKAFTSALQNKREALFAFSLIGGGFHGIHLRMRWLDGPPGTWQPGAGYRAVEMNTGAQFRFEVYHRFGFEGLEERPFAHPVGESTAMNPMIVGRIRRTDVP